MPGFRYSGLSGAALLRDLESSKLVGRYVQFATDEWLPFAGDDVHFLSKLYFIVFALAM